MLDLAKTDAIITQIGTNADKVLPILQALQREYGYLPQSALERVCETTAITPAAITGFSTFYDQFRFTPAGEHIVRVCVGTACHVKGAQTVYEAFLRYLNVPQGDDTDPQRQFTIERVACLGCCTLAPAVQIGDVTYGHLTADTVGNILEDYLRYEKARKKRKSKAARARVDKGLDRGVEYLRDGIGSGVVSRHVAVQVARGRAQGLCQAERQVTKPVETHAAAEANHGRLADAAHRRNIGEFGVRGLPRVRENPLRDNTLGFRKTWKLLLDTLQHVVKLHQFKRRYTQKRCIYAKT